MTKSQKEIVDNLSLFNNRTNTKKQWDIIFKGCGCPKSTLFWNALKEKNLEKFKIAYTLFDINSTTFNDIWERYCVANRAQAKKYYNKAKAKAKAKEITKSIKGTTFYIVGGVVTTLKPEREI